MPTTTPALVRRVYLTPAVPGARPVRHLVGLRPARVCAACSKTAPYSWRAASAATPDKYAQAYQAGLDLGAVLSEFLGVDLVGLGRMLGCL